MPAPENHLKKALASGRRLYGCWATFADPYATEIMATAGFDWLVIDGEHAPNDLRSMMHQLQVLHGRDSQPVVRLPMGEAWAIKQVLDIGAQSLLIPMVESAEQARDLVRATRYPPQGIRGSGAASARATQFSTDLDYIATANDQICLLVQVESRAGIEALDDILAVDGVDGVFIGPSDLSADMGYLGDTRVDEVQQVIRDALGRIATSDKAAGILALDHDVARSYRDWGAQFLAVGIDVLMLAHAARATMDRWRDG
ncbi:4-hydroxy-2-oxoheptanedioate aldolase [Roseovarius pacificus]|uniref:Hydroxypyruvate/pyruvate aldolase n=1 Tax=Roseovarius pacificus TaxID=337701 RepID=A0A1M7C5C5_9RHOB|nr:HpcH/HpaI aldolase/citrate lyase family protein [Roseovarius pacificus]GGO55805.1 2,4-dihydroxyhept-2-ene-1,7-dioic acid aldolase [Roseovarius pacificus]SHL62431.1 4-hydroxy-2-oxoheptanedioate aldolase [Roseovarius pacificus]